ncbi:MAG: tetraacyldisaccharide 4'-kinase [Sedimenticola sp.]|nr:tetraacyldisaccharide 4'-kinase [Sedimenticola sp.]
MKRLDHYWYSVNAVSILLLPLSWLFCLISWLRRLAYNFQLKSSRKLPVPVIVVGNITVGGTGKTPLVIWLTDYLREQGFSPGIISRGYGGKATHWPLEVTADSDPVLVGDEPVMLARRCGCSIWVGPDRPVTADALLNNTSCDILISDDGLQHYAMARDIEIAVIDGARGLGNGFCLPAGPLRERRGRLDTVDLVVANGDSELTDHHMTLAVGELINLADQLHLPAEHFSGQRVHGMAGIGNPQRFFNTLRGLGMSVEEHFFPDHYRFCAADITPDDTLPVIITEKDAVKCTHFSQQRHWYLEVSAKLPEGFIQQLDKQIRELRNG